MLHLSRSNHNTEVAWGASVNKPASGTSGTLRCSKHANYNNFVISIQCIVCMSFNVYRFLLLPFFQLLLCFCALICAVAAEK